jgi:hypothetical protein
MIDLTVIRMALMRSKIQLLSADDQDSMISFLIHDIFGGEILKKRAFGGWHFYNRIDGFRLDFSRHDPDIFSDNVQFDDIPVSPDEATFWFEAEQYTEFLFKFIRYFEEAVGVRVKSKLHLLNPVAKLRILQQSS